MRSCCPDSLCKDCEDYVSQEHPQVSLHNMFKGKAFMHCLIETSDKLKRFFNKSFFF